MLVRATERKLSFFDLTVLDLIRFYGMETAPVDRGWAVIFEGQLMYLCAVAFMPCKAIFGIEFIVLHHHPVSCYLRNY